MPTEAEFASGIASAAYRFGQMRAALLNLDLTSAINRLVLHNDPVELALLTDEQYATYLQALGDNQEAKRVIANIINRPIPGDDHAARSP